MKNYINFYYKLYPEEIKKKEKNYVFLVNLEKYYLIPYERSLEELDILLKLNNEMVYRKSLIHEIILTKDNNALILVDGIYYSLIRVYINETKIVTLDDIYFMIDCNDTIISNNILNHTDWDKLWETKIDYFEYHIGHLIKQYPYIYKTIDYYIGLGENAISYFKSINKLKKSFISIAHKRIGINSTLFELYNPYNLIIDYKIRDISEYLKDAFFNDVNIYPLINNFFERYMLDEVNLHLFFSRLLFPSYYFDLYENVIENNLNENIITSMLKKSTLYEEFLKYMIKQFPLKKIDWLNN